MQQTCAHLLQTETELHRALKRQELGALLSAHRRSGNPSPWLGQKCSAAGIIPSGGCCFPQEFIPVAEETQLIVDIGQGFVREGLRPAASVASSSDW